MILKVKSNKIRNSSILLSVNGKYTCFALDFHNINKAFVYILDESGAGYPDEYNLNLFNIVDNRISRYWEVQGKKYFDELIQLKEGGTFSFNEWKNPSFYENLYEGYYDEIEIFKKYKYLMENEFPQNELPDATLILENWIQCFFCKDGWEESQEVGICTCPACKTKQNNPLWKWDKT